MRLRIFRKLRRMEPNQLQQQFFNHLKAVIPPNISMVDELTSLLNLSYDSVYRRIRGEKPLALNELRQICSHYHISLDQVLQLQNDTVVFRAPDINDNGLPFEEYLKGLLRELKNFNSFKEKKMSYLCKDMTFFHFFLFPEFAAFKTFFWIKSILNNNTYSQKSFSFSEFPFKECFVIGQQIIEEYNQIPSVELWNFESINSSISQIQYYHDSGMFATREDFECVVDSLEKTLHHLQLQTEKGYKFKPGQSDLSYKGSLQFYVNEVILGNNTILIELDGFRQSYITYNVLSYLVSKDLRFNQKSFVSFHNLLSRAILISETGEKERNKFFRSLKEKVHNLKRSTLVS
jgi:hypothetical protein